MERSLHSLQKSSAFLRRIFFVLLVIATAFLLWMAAGLDFWTVLHFGANAGF